MECQPTRQAQWSHGCASNDKTRQYTYQRFVEALVLRMTLSCTRRRPSPHLSAAAGWTFGVAYLAVLIFHAHACRFCDAMSPRKSWYTSMIPVSSSIYCCCTVQSGGAALSTQKLPRVASRGELVVCRQMTKKNRLAHRHFNKINGKAELQMFRVRGVSNQSMYKVWNTPL